MAKYQKAESGGLYHEDYRLFLMQDKKPISPFHDIPLFVDKVGKAVDGNAKTGIFNMVVEIPRWTNAKMEISRDEPLNPIKQDSKKNKPRFVHNVFPHKGYIWNYGAFPQTWEDPEHVTPETGCKGDRDPLDVCEIGRRVAERGDILQVKPLGVIALCDEGETDWKVIVIDVNDALADKLNDITDVEKHMPGLIQESVDWFRYYEIPDGKPPNRIAFDGKAKGRDVALRVLYETHEYWKKLVMEKSDRGPDWSCLNTCCKGSPFLCEEKKASDIFKNQPARRKDDDWNSELDTWHFIDRNSLGKNEERESDEQNVVADGKSFEPDKTKEDPVEKSDASKPTSSFVFGQNLSSRVSNAPNQTGPGFGGFGISSSMPSRGFGSLAAGNSAPTGFLFAQALKQAPIISTGFSGKPASSEFSGDTSDKIEKDQKHDATSFHNGEDGEGNEVFGATEEKETLQESAKREYDAKQAKPLLEEVEVKTGEENEKNIFEISLKLHVFDKESQQWKERGRAIARLNDAHDRTYSRLVIRMAGTLRIITNTKLWPEMIIKKQSEKNVSFCAFDSTDDNMPKIFLISCSEENAELIYRETWTRVDRLKREGGSTGDRLPSQKTELSPSKSDHDDDASSSAVHRIKKLKLESASDATNVPSDTTTSI